ncbi:ENTH/VHS family protein [Actinidia rufa]|uniref:ENTH/VHS family protein n=1 Tax=Actinidia rufa TaxID=165716 RepID=A0A7J0H0X6_9ERIC|nr:ENTH/VHS family protein [Actinidia rufa]
MDFMKVIDQTVREIKREVNLKVLKVPEIEQKVLDATDDEPWGPHGSVLAEIAQATKKFSECQMVMNVLWTRLGETGRNWRYVYKSLAVIEYLVGNGSDRAVDDIVEHTFQISSLASFEYVEPNGKDMGINVRKKAETIVALLNNKDKIQEVRNKAAANREKYFGLSSSGITYKSGSASSGSSSFQSGDKYGGLSGTKDSNTFKDTHEDNVRSGEEKFDQSTSAKSRRAVISENQGITSKKGSTRYGSKGQEISESGASSSATESSTLHSNNYEDDFDDFDPRGTSTASLYVMLCYCGYMELPPPHSKNLPEISKSQELHLQGSPKNVEGAKAPLSKNLHMHAHTHSSYECMCARGINVDCGYMELGGRLPSEDSPPREDPASPISEPPP